MTTRFLPLLVLLALCGLFAAGLWREGPDGTVPAPVLAPYPAAALDLPALSPGPSGLTHPVRARVQDFSGHWVFVNFFASWCGPCAAEMADLKALADEEGNKLVILGIAYKDQAPAIAAWLERYGSGTSPYPYAVVGADDDGRAGIDWGITGVPESFLVNPKGLVVWRMAGPIDADMIEHEIKPKVNADAPR